MLYTENMLNLILLGTALRKDKIRWTVWKDGNAVFFRQEINIDSNIAKEFLKSTVTQNVMQVLSRINDIGRNIQITNEDRAVVLKVVFDNPREAIEFRDTLISELEKTKYLLITIAERFETDFRKYVASLLRSMTIKPLEDYTSTSSSSEDEDSPS